MVSLTSDVESSADCSLGCGLLFIDTAVAGDAIVVAVGAATFIGMVIGFAIVASDLGGDGAHRLATLADAFFGAVLLVVFVILGTVALSITRLCGFVITDGGV